MKTKLLPYLVATSMAMLSACGGGGGSSSSSGGGSSTSVSGLDIPVTLSVVTPKETTAGARVLGLKAGYKATIAALNDPTTDFTTDEQHSWVHDRALEPLDEVNNILCYVGQTAADQLVNQTYIALVDSSKCERSGEQSGGQDQSSGGGKTVELEKWIVKSTRADNNSPQYVQLWVPKTSGDEMPMEIRAEVTVTEGASDTNPFGKFVLNFVGVAAEDFTPPWPGATPVTQGTTLMSGTLKTVDTLNGKIGFTMYQSDPAGGSRKVSVVADADQSAGVAFTGNTEYDFDPTANGGSGGMVATEKAHAVAFNTANILVKHDLTFDQLAAINSESEGSGAVCLSRTGFKRNVWRYNVYHAADGTFNGKTVTAGQRVELNSGFPFRWDSDSDGALDSYGYAGYWGLWSEKEPAAGWDGATITKETWGQNATTENFTVAQTPGKLTKREKQTLLLADLDGTTFHYSDWNTGTEYIVEYDSDASIAATAGFYKTKTVVYNPNSPPTETSITPALITLSAGEWLGMWSEGLGGGVNYIGGNNYVTFFKESFVDANDSVFTSADPVVLDCYTNCLVPDLSTTQYEDPWTPSNGAHYADSTDVTIPAAVYHFDKSTLSLKVAAVAGNSSHADVGKTIKLATTYTYDPMSGNPEPWGISIDGLVPGGTVLTSVWDTYDQATSFRWETGHKSWNKLVRVKDANGNMVAFDKPMAFSYKHSSANDANYNADAALDASDPQYFNQTFMMNYGGNGDLWGIPWVGDWTQGDSRPAFALVDGAVMGANNEFVVKAIDMELKPLTATGQCGALVLNQPAEPLPTAASGTPSNASTAAPTPDSEAPAAIAGEVVE